MKTDYSKLSEITAKTQKELDRIPKDFTGTVYIEFGTATSPAIVRDKFGYHVEARKNSFVAAQGNSHVTAYGESYVSARENSYVTAYGESYVKAWGNSFVKAHENSSVMAWGNSSVVAWGKSRVTAQGNSYVIAHGEIYVLAIESSHVVAQGTSHVMAWGNSSVEAWENSYVEAKGNSSVKAYENSRVVARDNSSVEARGNSQIVDCLTGGKGTIKISGNTRIVYNPKNVHEYVDFYGLSHTKKYGTFYKAVHKTNGKYVSEYDCRFKYDVGKTAKSKHLDTNVNEPCGEGIHMAYLQWVLDFGEDWDDLAILEVKAKLDNVIVPLNAGKLRVDEVKVIREVPLEECGLYGKILANRR